MSYKINLGQWNGIFAVPSSVVDKHIKLASEAQLKVLLYLLRHSDKEISETELAEKLRISAEEVKNAVDFWIERELLRADGSELSPSDKPCEIPAATPQTVETEPKAPKKQSTKLSRAQRPDPAFVAKIITEDSYLKNFIDDAESKLKKTLSPGDTATLVMLYDTFGLPCDVIALLIDHLVESNCASMHNIEKIGIKWADEGITDSDLAEREIEYMENSQEAWKKVSRLLGIRNIGRPTKAQTEYAHRWLYTWSFNDEMITEAYERCINTKGEYSISYINAILKKWHEKDIKSLDRLKEVESSEPVKKPKPAKKPSSKSSVFSLEGASFDINKFENDSLFDD